MHLVTAAQAVPYDPPGHHDVAARRLQGLDAGGPGGFSVGLSHYPPGSTVDSAPTAAETVYVVLSGELELTCDDRVVTLGRHDSVHLTKGEVRSLRNASGADATLLVVLRP
ncbi:cupin domain-containing protein [Actinomadura sp. ATCC 31491]|uniref:Cupin domain-containing protein n=1 Tax=Actinomadura luzonensis TaxID=2805427 RepID=A0ABT0G790_9ACTN|nr:cupin domain-containing protein [Actinomadura luzonensis]MCK2220466.1 cupin domain-containing protein [Actinomadura luzonensis]